MWTRFMDMHSGGQTKEPPYQYIYIEAPEKEAKIIFYNRFGHNPDRVSCTCCGSDYSISEDKSLLQISAFERNCEWDDKKERYIEKQQNKNMEIRENCHTKKSDPWGLYIPLKNYLKQKDVLVIRAKDIKKSERVGEIPEQGYVWKD